MTTALAPAFGSSWKQNLGSKSCRIRFRLAHCSFPDGRCSHRRCRWIDFQNCCLSLNLPAIPLRPARFVKSRRNQFCRTWDSQSHLQSARYVRRRNPRLPRPSTCCRGLPVDCCCCDRLRSICCCSSYRSCWFRTAIRWLIQNDRNCRIPWIAIANRMTRPSLKRRVNPNLNWLNLIAPWLTSKMRWPRHRLIRTERMIFSY